MKLLLPANPEQEQKWVLCQSSFRWILHVLLPLLQVNPVPCALGGTHFNPKSFRNKGLNIRLLTIVEVALNSICASEIHTITF